VTCECGDCWDLPGSIVTHKLTGWKGIIIGDRDGCMFLTVRFWIPGTGLGTIEVSRFEVEPPANNGDGGGGSEIGTEEANVIPVDFTKGVKLTKSTKTRGVA